jgi:hypothetical protein
MLRMRMLSVLTALTLATAGSLVGTGPDGSLTLVAQAQAAADVAVTVTVAKGTAGGGSSVDKALAKHSKTLGRIGGYGDWKSAGGSSMKVAIGKTETKSLGGNTMTVTLDSISADKAKTTTVVTDSKGKPHKVSSSLGRGGTQVLVVEGADGKSALVYIVTVNY